MYKINNNGVVIEEQTVKLFESFLEVKLTKSYRDFLLKFNGGNITPNIFSLGDEGEDTIKYFYKINSNNNYDDLVYHYKLYMKRIPKDCLSIGCDNFGNQILLVLKGKYREKIYFWDHEYETSDDENITQDNMILIANTFNSFLEVLA